MTELITLALQVINQAMAHIPDYSSRKREKYFKLIQEYENAITNEVRDDNRVAQLELELRQFLKAFGGEVRETSKNSFV